MKNVQNIFQKQDFLFVKLFIAAFNCKNGICSIKATFIKN